MSASAIEIFPRAMTPGHLPVMSHEVLEYLAPHAGQRMLVSTSAPRGHTRLALGAGAHVSALDRDAAAAARTADATAGFSDRCTFVALNFGDLAAVRDTGFDGILFD